MKIITDNEWDINGYEVVHLGDIAEIIAGQSPPSSTYNYENNGLPFFQGKTDFGDIYPNLRVWCSDPIKIALPNDILISVRAPVGPTNICNVKSCIGRGLSAIRSNKYSYYKYIFYFLRYIECELVKKGRGSTFSAITQEDLSQIRIPLPFIEEQKRIADIMDIASSMIKKRKETIKLANEFLNSTFLEMFGDPANNTNHYRVFSLSQLCNKITDGTHDTPSRISNGIKFITGKHIRPFNIDFDNSDFIDPEIHKEIYRRCNPQYGDILYTNIGVNVGTSAMCTVDYEFSMKNVALLKNNRELITSRYLEHVLNNSNMKKKILGSAIVGGAQQFLSLKTINEITIPVPPIEEQSEFCRVVENAFSLKLIYNESQKEMENQLNSLMQKAFSGKL